jgi:hypothetical protein
LAEETQQVEIRVLWDGIEAVPIMLANQALGQIGQQGEVILTFGQIAPPALTGDPDQQRQQAKEIRSLAIKPVARLAVTRAGLDDLIRILSETRENYDKLQDTMAQLTESGDEK